MKREIPLFSLLVGLILMAPSSAMAENINFLPGVGAAKRVLEKEIERDEKIVSYKMNLIRLRQTKGKLALDLPTKQNVITQLKRDGGGQGAINTLISLLTQTTIGEQAILDGGTSRRLRRQAHVTLSANLPKKIHALKMLK